MSKMNTQMLSAKDTQVAAKILREGGLVAIPTETVYGLAANALDENAVRKIFVAKGRPSDNPLIVHISKVEEIKALVRDFTPDAQRLAEAFWPGPLTIILKKSDAIPDVISGGLDTVAIRLPAHPVAREIIEAAGCPLAAPSANLSGSPSPTRASHVIDDLSGKIDAIVDAGACEVGLESTVISLCTTVPRVLRPGAVTVEQLRKVLGNVEVDAAVLSQLEKNVAPTSPGMKYKHYAPRAKVAIINGSREQYISYINTHGDSNVAALCYEEDAADIAVTTVTYGSEADPSVQATKLFDALRKCDELAGIDLIYARCPSQRGVGLAVYNRLLRAAGFDVINL